MADETLIDVHKDTSTRPAITGKKQAKPKKEGEYKVGKNKPPIETQFKPGQSGNPAGKTPGSLSLLGILKKRLSELHPDEKRTFAEVFIDNTLQDAMDLDGPSRKMIMQYIEGMPKQQMIIDTNKDSVGELTEFFRNVAEGKSIIKGPDEKPANIETNATEPGGPTSA